ncbi:alanine dehydrogenase, partial [Vibrio furnissii]|nr:alanine dehydrogenase [Vibrio furnissii]
RTSTFALNNATLPYIVKLANKGYREALTADKGFLLGLNVIHGKVTCKEVAESFNLEYVDPAEAIRMFN